MRRLREAPALRILELREVGLRRCWHAGRNRDIRASHFPQQAVEEFGAHFRVAKSGCNTKNLQLGTTQCQGYGESIVNVIADVRVDDDFLRRRSSSGSGWRRTLSDAARRNCERNVSQRQNDNRTLSVHGVLRPLGLGPCPRKNDSESISSLTRT